MSPGCAAPAVQKIRSFEQSQAGRAQRARETPIGWPRAGSAAIDVDLFEQRAKIRLAAPATPQKPKDGDLPGPRGETTESSHGAISKHTGDGRTYAGRTDQPPRP